MPSIFLTYNIVILIASCVLWIRGYSLFKFFLLVSGGIAGLMISNYISNKLNLDIQVYFFLSIILIVAMASLFWFAYRLSFTLAGAAMGIFFLVHYGNKILNLNLEKTLLVGALIGALIGLFFHKTFLVVATSWLGSIGIINTLTSMYENKSFFDYDFYPFLASSPLLKILFVALPIFLTVLGTQLQYHQIHKKD